MTQQQVVNPRELISNVVQEYNEMHACFKMFSLRLQELHDHPELTSDRDALIRIRQFTQTAAISLELAYYALGDASTAFHQIHSLVYRGHDSEVIASADKQLGSNISRHSYIGQLYAEKSNEQAQEGI